MAGLALRVSNSWLSWEFLLSPFHKLTLCFQVLRSFWSHEESLSLLARYLFAPECYYLVWRWGYQNNDICMQEDDPEDKETIYGLGNKKNRYFHELIESEGVIVYSSTIELIKELKQSGVKVGVASSSKNCKAIMARAGNSSIVLIQPFSLHSYDYLLLLTHKVQYRHWSNIRGVHWWIGFWVSQIVR